MLLGLAPLGRQLRPLLSRTALGTLSARASHGYSSLVVAGQPSCRSLLDVMRRRESPSKASVVSLRHCRWLSSSSSGGKQAEEEVDETQLAPLTTAQKVQVGFNLSLWALGLGLAGTCAYFIVRELMPTKLSPNRMFDVALEEVRKDETVRRLYGEPLKGYGRDHGGHREGRRNFIENSAYDEKADGSRRVRVRFNVKGPYADGFVFAEKSNKHEGWVYLMVQDKRTGRVVTIVDDRQAILEAKSMRTDAERGALADLLKGPTFDSGKRPHQ